MKMLPPTRVRWPARAARCARAHQMTAYYRRREKMMILPPYVVIYAMPRDAARPLDAMRDRSATLMPATRAIRADDADTFYYFTSFRHIDELGSHSC